MIKYSESTHDAAGTYTGSNDSLIMLTIIVRTLVAGNMYTYILNIILQAHAHPAALIQQNLGW